jgi:hypothetical protein
MFLNRCTVAAAALVLSLAAAVGDGARAEQGERAVTCTNPYSGFTWQIRIDYDHRTVDANPARISDSEIAWQDAKDGSNYALDRASGKLTVVIPSSTGGYFLHDQCKLPD